MPSPHYEVADVLRLYGSRFISQYGHRLTGITRKVLEAILRCATGALGTHIKECSNCAHQVHGANTCRNRHCPKCSGGKAAEWLANRASELINTPYLHITFTLPHDFNLLFLANKRVVGNIFFRAVKETLLEIGASEKYLGAEIGFFSVLHTWGAKLDLHLHIHNLVTAGGLSFDETSWVALKYKSYFAPETVLSLVFRGKFIAFLKSAYYNGELNLLGELQHLENPSSFESYLSKTYKHRWVVDCQTPIYNPLFVLKYLARYVSRIAISNNRIVSIDNGVVRFCYKDYRRSIQRILSLDAVEFIRRFSMHIMPQHFTRIRYYGFLSSPRKKSALAKAQQILGTPKLPDQLSDQEQEEVPANRESCQSCNTGKMKTIAICIPAVLPFLLNQFIPNTEILDSS